ncbi:hypothetical protein KJ966_11160 [bacterium]|nr:hypothetical protein [bacterium]
MKQAHSFKPWLTIFLVIALIFLGGCISNDDDDDDDNDSPSTAVTTNTITGTAAAGLPIIGIVNVKGANGNTASADIDSDGNYELDVTSLTAPYVLKAVGRVNDESVELYSTGVAAGNINITPITNYITSKVIPNLDTAFDNWATESTSVNATALQAAEAAVQKQMAPILKAYGITDEIDLMSVEFDTDHSGMDAVLDIIEIEIDDSNNVTITNTATNTTVTGDEIFSDSEGTALVLVISETAAMNVFWSRVSELFASSMPTASQIDSQIAPFVADDFIGSGGTTKSDEMNCWVAGNCMPTGVSFSLTINCPMESSEFSASYSKGYWVNVYYSFGSTEGIMRTAMVYNGTNWLWYGNQEWVNIWFKFGATKRINTDGSVNYNSDFFIDVEDQKNYAYNAGIRYTLLKGPGFPVDVGDGYRYLSQATGFPDDNFSPDTYTFTDDASVSTVPENSEYWIMLFETNDFYSTSPLQTYKRTVPGKPFLPTEISDNMFPTFTQPNSNSISALNIGGNVTYTWTNHAECKVENAWFSWCTGGGPWSGGTCLEMSKGVTQGAETITFDTSHNTISSPDWGRVEILCNDLQGRKRWIDWYMQ